MKFFNNLYVTPTHTTEISGEAIQDIEEALQPTQPGNKSE